MTNVPSNRRASVEKIDSSAAHVIGTVGCFVVLSGLRLMPRDYLTDTERAALSDFEALRFVAREIER